MKVLLVNGSPHRDGSTFLALKEMEKALKQEGVESEIYFIGMSPIATCRACLACRKLGKCVIVDNVNEFVELCRGFDGFVFGTPVHYASASGIITSFLDRVFYSAFSSGRGDIFEHKPGTAIAVARRGGTTATLDQINKYFSISQMPIISGRYWNMVHAQKPTEIYADEEGIQNLRILARNMAYHLKCKEAAQNAGITPPEKEKPTLTNFVRSNQ